MPEKATILVAEDDDLTRELLGRVLRREGYAVEEATNGTEALQRLRQRRYDLVVSDVQMTGASGMEILTELGERSPDVPVILVTAYAEPGSAMDAITRGAADYLGKPVDVVALRNTVARALERRHLSGEIQRLHREAAGRKSLVGTSPAMLDLYKQIAHVAPTNATVTVVGESGAGKELVARTLHERSRRAQGPWVAVNCASITESLLETELFGHEKGAFTGASGARRGLFEEAHGGTLFLDEIGDVSPRMQSQLLRVLQEGEVRRVGGNAAIPVDVRIVAATNRQLENDVAEKRFRADLYYRLNVVTLQVPPLRERGDDVVALARYFAARHAASLGRPVPDIREETLEKIRAYPWPGNVRELENAMARAVAMSQRAVLIPSDLPSPVGESRGGGGTSGVDADWPTLDELQRRYIERVLQKTEGNKTAAAQVLGIDRRTLQRLFARGSLAEESGLDDEPSERSGPHGQGR